MSIAQIQRPIRNPNPFWKRTLPFFAILLLWWTATSGLQLLPAYVFPTPEAVVRSGVRLFTQGVLVETILSSIRRMVGGFVIASALGITIGIVVGTNKHVALVVEPIAKFFQAVAGPTWIPLAVLWFGLGWFSVAFIVFNTVFFIVFYNTLMGVETVNRRLVDSIRTLGGQRWDVLKDVVIPGAVPSILVGMRLGIAYGWRALIAGEIIASGRGLGVLIWEGQRLFRIPDIVLGLLLIGVISLIMDKVLIGILERYTIEKWRMKSSIAH